MTGRRKYRSKPLAIEATVVNSNRLYEQRRSRAATPRQQLW